MSLSIPNSIESAKRTMEFLLAEDTALETRVEFLQSRPVKAATVEELLGYREALWERRRPATFPKADLDIVGTGGIKAPRYNVSSTCAIILAAMGHSVAKHGNRGSKASNGAFDFLEAIGLNLDRLTELAPTALEQRKLAFLFARDWHPTFKAIAQARAQVKEPTVFNLLGPLMNPASPQYQIIGCVNPDSAQVLANAMLRLGIKGAVVSSEIDEVSITGPTQVFRVSEAIDSTTITPADFNLPTYPEAEAQGGDSQANAEDFFSLIGGVGRPAIRDLVIANAAFALSTKAQYPLPIAAELVTNALDKGRVAEYFAGYSEFYQGCH